MNTESGFPRAKKHPPSLSGTNHLLHHLLISLKMGPTIGTIKRKPLFIIKECTMPQFGVFTQTGSGPFPTVDLMLLRQDSSIFQLLVLKVRVSP